MPEILRYAAFTVDGEVAIRPGSCSTRRAWTRKRCSGSRRRSTTPRPRSSGAPRAERLRRAVFAPRQEVPFCGHATIAAAVALAEREPAEVMVFHTPAGLVSINTEQTKRGWWPS